MDDNFLLKGMADNPALTEAVRKLIEEEFSTPSVNSQMSNELIGQITRSKLEGLDKLDKAFKKLAKYKTVEVIHTIKNPAR